MDTCSGRSIFKSKTCEKFPKRFHENIIIQEITNQKHKSGESSLGAFNIYDSQNVYICNLDIDFHGLLEFDFLEYYKDVNHFNKEQLLTNFKTLYTK